MASEVNRTPQTARYLREDEGKRLLRAYGIAVPREAVVRSRGEAATAARDIGFPVVMKVVSPDVAHKTDAGGVRLNVRSTDAATSAYEDIIRNVRASRPGARIEGILVAEQVSVEQELFCGMTRDPQFGPVIAFGLGGIFVEILKDVTHGVIPLEEMDALEMIRGIRGYPVLAGARGAKPADERALAAVLLAVAKLSQEHPEVAELDINPLAAAADGRLVALDCFARLTNG